MIRIIRAIKRNTKLLSVAFIIIVCFIFFWRVFVQGLLPIPSDTIIGLYHPFRDLYAHNFPNGIPFKNFLITDPVRQTYVWKELVISLLKTGQLPLWNPYNFSGTPLLASFQSGVFYPFNIIFFDIPFSSAWSIFIILQPLLAGIFLYLYLNSLKLNKFSSALGGIVFAFCGFSIAWLEWGTVLHTGMWIPLVLLSIDKLFEAMKGILNSKNKIVKIHIKNKKFIIWSFIFTISLSSSFSAGHLQTFFYLFILSLVYFFARWFQFGKNKRVLFTYLILNTIFIILTAVQWIPTLRFISLSARSIDQNWQNIEGWFIPWQHLIQFVSPDFFGNPTTLNYWGTWNYAELVGYIGILPLIFSLFALFLRRDKRTFFFGSMFFISLIFSLPTIFAKLPFILGTPFLKTAQPTRLLFLTDFSLAILSALGFDYFLKSKERFKIFYSVFFIGVVFTLLWVFLYIGHDLQKETHENILVAKRNIIFPTIFFGSSSFLILCSQFIKRNKKASYLVYFLMFCLVIFDLFRFGWKFTPFVRKEFLFPPTRAIEFLKLQKGEFRIASSDSRIFPPNFSAYYRLQSIEGYDPLYLRGYGELISSSERNRGDISTSFGFNRIITPHNLDSKIIDLLGVKYVLALSDLHQEKFKKVFQEGETIIYENKNVVPRVFFATNLEVVNSKEEAMKIMFKENFAVGKDAVVEEDILKINKISLGNARITKYSENQVTVETENKSTGFMVLTDTFYPSWKVRIDEKETKIILTDYNFRGVLVPAGKHTIVFYNNLF